jgi:hypothetical protein
VGVVAERSQLPTIGGLGTWISADMYFQRPGARSRAFAFMAHFRKLRSLSCVAVVDMSEICETVMEGQGSETISRGTTSRRRFSPLQGGQGETINQKTKRYWLDPPEQGQRRGSTKY